MFPATRKLPSLTQLTIDIAGSRWSVAGYLGLCSGDMQRLAGCCPNLQQLCLREGLRHLGATFCALRLLTGLTSLTLDIGQEKPTEAVPNYLTQLTGLRRLRVEGPLPDAALQQLTALSRLTDLDVAAGRPGAAAGLSLWFECEESPPTVWLQLVGHFCLRKTNRASAVWHRLQRHIQGEWLVHAAGWCSLVLLLLYGACKVHSLHSS
ncbi:hypothetical protein OEZ86_005034 [Tetradesmus obliquus]|nr:hypothetical protein OEZ86_005034 [Tetradesmus obliquus]